MSQSNHEDNGLVVASFGRRCLVRPDDGSPRLKCQIRRKAGQVVCGDRVSYAATGNEGVIEAVAERRNSFPRSDRYGRPQIVAANLDRIVVVIAPHPEPTRDLINRYLVACQVIGIPAVLCLNKQDLLTDSERQDWHDRLELYRQLDYPVLLTAAKMEQGIDPLRAELRQGVSILVGQSGVGKSSLINALVPDLDLKTREISQATGKGRHTTTASTLYRCDKDGAIVDSPGVWEYGIWRMEAAEVCSGFPEFHDYIGDCRFSNCSHIHEPGCGLVSAAEAGHISPERLESYRRIVAAMQGNHSD
jgi:ribosome biogenesis GTPase